MAYTTVNAVNFQLDAHLNSRQFHVINYAQL